MHRYLIVLLVLFVAPVSFAQTTSPMPVTRVTLYTSGVGYFERTGIVTGDSSSTLFFPVEQVNDVLKSLVLLDYGGGLIEPVTYGAQDPLSKQLKAFSVDLSDDPDEATFLDRLRGASVTVSVAGGSPVVGTILGVETKTVQLPGESSAPQSFLNLITTDSLVSFPLSSVAGIQINDPALRQEIQKALATVALGRDASNRPVTINFSGKGDRKVLIGYLTQTPLWQTSYRLVLGKNPYLQGWALVQNTSQEDWNSISLSLVAGRPISFIQDLYTPIYVDRPIIQPQVIGSPTPQLYSSNLDVDQSVQPVMKSSVTAEAPVALNPQPFAFEQRRVHINGNVNALAAPPAEAITADSLAGSAALRTNGAALGTSLFSYVIKVPVTVPRQKSAMIPFIGTNIQAQRVSIFNAGIQPNHPLTGARLTNTSSLHLMGGPMTVFDDDSSGSTGYVGDALIDDTEPGQTRLLSFAVDLAVDAAVSNGDSGRTSLVTLEKGVLFNKVVNDFRTLYTFKNNSGQDRALIVEHPYSDDNSKLIEPPTYSERTSDVYRFDLTVPAHQAKSLKVVLERTDIESYQITDLDGDNLLQYVQGGGISQPVKDALRRVIELRQLVADTQTKIAANEASSAQISTGQDRIRKNMVVLDKSTPLYKRYADELDSQETQLDALTATHATLETELSSRQNDLSSYLANLSVN